MAGNAGPGGDAGADAKVNKQSQQNFSTTSNPMLYHRIQHPQRPQVSIEFVQAILELDQVQSLFPQNLQYSLAYHHTRQLLRDAGRGGDGGNGRATQGCSGMAGCMPYASHAQLPHLPQECRDVCGMGDPFHTHALPPRPIFSSWRVCCSIPSSSVPHV